MGCAITTGKARYCSIQPGGLKTAFIGNFFEDTNHAKIISVAKTDGVAVANVGVAIADSTKTFKAFSFTLDPYLSSLNQTIVVNEGGAVGYQQELTLIFKGAYGKADVVMQNLIEGTYQIMVLDNAGTVYLCGLYNGMKATGGSFIHGGDVALTDNLSYTITFQSIEMNPADNMGSVQNMAGQQKITVQQGMLDGS